VAVFCDKRIVTSIPSADWTKVQGLHTADKLELLEKSISKAVVDVPSSTMY